jgi:lysophospholipase L1-like esterase
MTPVQLGPWLALREIILHQSATGTLVLDAAAILGARNGALLDGTYRQGLSNDGRHPNDSGHQTLSEHLLALLGQVIAGLPRPPPHRAG